MKRPVYILLILLFIAGAGEAYAQKYPERKYVRQGNRAYEKEEYTAGEIFYRRALGEDPLNVEAANNLGNSLYRQGRFQEAVGAYANTFADTTRVVDLPKEAQVHYNSGNAFFQERKLKEALEAYKNSLRLNPDDQDAKFNLAYVKKMLENEQNDDGGGGGDDNDQNQDQNQDKNQDQNQNDPDKGDPDKQDQQQQQPQSGMNREEADRMLEAMQMSEDKTRDKMDEKKPAVVGRSGKNW